MSHKKTNNDFVAASVNIHGNKYDYSKSNYINNRIKVEIVCKIHGSFWQISKHHMAGRGCPKCMADKVGNQFRSNQIEFVENAKKVHGNLYDYEKVYYYKSKWKVEIVCKKHNRSFWQQAGSHLRGAGCPQCALELITSGGWMVDKGSLEFGKWLNEKGYDFQSQYYIPEMGASLDFYNPTTNVVIEYDSRYHHSPKQQIKDRERERKIIDLLHPVAFWRIDEKTKTARNILSC